MMDTEVNASSDPYDTSARAIKKLLSNLILSTDGCESDEYPKLSRKASRRTMPDLMLILGRRVTVICSQY
jgi:hypothetical protein